MFPVGPYRTSHSQFWPKFVKPQQSIRHKFTKAEDELLKSLVEKHGESNWITISAAMKTRSPRQCRERYKNYLSPKIQNGPWTPEEEQLLIEKVKELGQRWSNIALYFEPRSDVNVKNHWSAMVNRQLREKNQGKSGGKQLSEPINLSDKIKLFDNYRKTAKVNTDDNVAMTKGSEPDLHSKSVGGTEQADEAEGDLNDLFGFEFSDDKEENFFDVTTGGSSGNDDDGDRPTLFTGSLKADDPFYWSEW